MTRWRCALAGALLFIAAVKPAPARADTVRLVLRDGLVTLDAVDATPASILEAWSREGGVAFVNAERIPSAPLTLTLENVPEGEALDIILRPVSGYLARRRGSADAAGNRSMFDRIVILATPAQPRVASPAQPARAASPGSGPVFPQPPPAAVAAAPDAAPAGIPREPGVVRLVGPDGQPVPDDQEDTPPPPIGADAPSQPARAPTRLMPVQPQPPNQLPPPASAGAPPVGVPVPGMVVPSPAAPEQPGAPQPPR